jgi:hypothetical protein
MHHVACVSLMESISRPRSVWELVFLIKAGIDVVTNVVLPYELVVVVVEEK